MTTALYSDASWAVRSSVVSVASSACTQRAAPGPSAIRPTSARVVPRSRTAALPPGTRPMRSTVATVPYSAYSPWTRGTIRTSALVAPAVDRMPGKDAWLGVLAWADSTAARVSVSVRSSGTTMPGSTTSSSSGSTGRRRVSDMCTPRVVESA